MVFEGAAIAVIVALMTVGAGLFSVKESGNVERSDRKLKIAERRAFKELTQDIIPSIDPQKAARAAHETERDFHKAGDELREEEEEVDGAKKAVDNFVEKARDASKDPDDKEKMKEFERALKDLNGKVDAGLLKQAEKAADNIGKGDSTQNALNIKMLEKLEGQMADQLDKKDKQIAEAMALIRKVEDVSNSAFRLATTNQAEMEKKFKDVRLACESLIKAGNDEVKGDLKKALERIEVLENDKNESYIERLDRCK